MRTLSVSFVGSFALVTGFSALLAIPSTVPVTKTHAAGRRVTAASPAPGPSGYHLLKKIPLGGEGFWDYIIFDSPTRRLFISRGTKVVVLDVDSGNTSNGRAGTVTIFDLKTLEVIGSVQAGTNPDAIIYDPASKRVFAMNGRSKNATAIDAATGNVAGTIPVDGKPEFAVADGAGHVYVNIEDKSE
ncbi:MAG: hypothetical protein ABSF40_17655, partial [Candidatus Acidiferrales bacterium]